MVLLVNEGTASYGEWMASLLKRECNAVLVGTQTSGCEFCVVRVEAPDGSKLQFGGYPYERLDGIEAFQSIGMTPDIQVPLSRSETVGGSMTQALLNAHARQTAVGWETLLELCPDR